MLSWQLGLNMLHISNWCTDISEASCHAARQTKSLLFWQEAKVITKHNIDRSFPFSCPPHHDWVMGFSKTPPHDINEIKSMPRNMVVFELASRTSLYCSTIVLASAVFVYIHCFLICLWTFCAHPNPCCHKVPSRVWWPLHGGRLLGCFGGVAVGSCSNQLQDIRWGSFLFHTRSLEFAPGYNLWKLLPVLPCLNYIKLQFVSRDLLVNPLLLMLISLKAIFLIPSIHNHNLLHCCF